MKTCFVITPFGKTQEEKDLFSSVFEIIIKPVLADLNYDVNRADTNPENVGNITKNIMRDIIESDLAIADMTNANANVFYELGIRHALHRCATILIIQKGSRIPFDLSQHIAIEYSPTLPGLTAAREEIRKAVLKYETVDRKTNTDNIVYDFYPSLTIGNIPNEATKERLEMLENEVKKYREVIEQHNIKLDETNSDDKQTIYNRLQEANDAVSKSGAQAILKIHECANAGDNETFITLLSDALYGHLLTVDQYVQLSRICDQMNMIPHRLVVLEEASRMFPDEYTIVGLLADTYSDYPDPVMRNKGCAYIEKYMKISYNSEDLPIATDETLLSDELLMGLFNLYISLSNWDAIISFCLSVQEYGEYESMITKNLARAYIAKKLYSKAEEMLLKAIEREPEDDGLYTVMSTLYKEIKDYPNMLDAQEHAIIADPMDMRNYINLAIHILNWGYIRDENETIIGPVKNTRRYTECYSIFNFIFSHGASQADLASVISILTKRNQTNVAHSLINKGKIDVTEETTELAYILKRIEVI